MFFEEIAQRLVNNSRVELRGFGAFSLRERDPRRGLNPRTIDAVHIPGKRVPYFNSGKMMRARIDMSSLRLTSS